MRHKTLVEIRPSAFGSITGITKVTCLATTPPVSGEYFTDAVYQNATLYVPMRSLERYMNAVGWRNFQHIEGIDTGDDFLLGDVNRDEEVNITDAIDLINYLLSDTGDIDLLAADVNEDSEINITDAIELINYLLNDQWPD